MKNTLYLFLCLLLSTMTLQAQEDDLLSLLGEDEPSTNYTIASFKTNRVINLHSLENTAPGVFDLKFSHRFNSVENGFYDFFGLDGATMRFGGDWGITEKLQIGIGRSTIGKTYDGYAKYKVLRQSTGKKVMPITMAFMAGASVETLKDLDPDKKRPFWDRWDYTFQMIVGRKFSENFSLQLSPTLVHRNLVATRDDFNDIYALGVGLRQKITKRVTLNLEYNYVPDNLLSDEFVDSYSIGFDIETGGHVFQLHFTNSRAQLEKAFIAETTGEKGFDLGNIRFGFNISRVFTVWDPKK